MRETPKAAAAFDEYCLLGPARSLRKLAENHTKTTPKPHQNRENITRQFKEWSTAHNWQERVREYDKEQAEAKRLKHLAEIEEMNARHADIGMKQQEKAMQQIDALIKAKAFGSVAAVQLLKLSTDLERLSRGAPTERTEQTGDASGAEWQMIRATLVQTLAAFPDARLAVAESLAKFEKPHDEE